MTQQKKIMLEVDEQDDGILVEETWTNADGSNVFDDESCYHSKLKISTIGNIFPDKVVALESYAAQQMTPLDMTYGDAEKNRDEFYDGTGSLVWLASIAFCHMVAQDLIPQLKSNQKKEQLICELGCGVGLASIATIMASADRNNRTVVFTDNDQDALDLCRRNCELNNLEPTSYCQEILAWGTPLLDGNDEEGVLKESSFDIVLATDVIYDISMLPPLLQTAFDLLKWNAKFIISHVPRFCLPKDNEKRHGEAAATAGIGSSPQQELEEFIKEHAQLMGFRLRDTMRPHKVLSNIPRTTQGGEVIDEVTSTISLQHLQEAQAVLFIFEKDQKVP